MFSITYETVTPESAEYGDSEDSGWIVESASLSDCYSDLRNAGAIGCHVEANSYPVSAPRWLTFYKVEENYTTGAETSWALHIPDRVTPASRRRIARLFNCYGVK